MVPGGGSGGGGGGGGGGGAEGVEPAGFPPGGLRGAGRFTTPSSPPESCRCDSAEARLDESDPAPAALSSLPSPPSSSRSSPGDSDALELVLDADASIGASPGGESSAAPRSAGTPLGGSVGAAPAESNRRDLSRRFLSSSSVSGSAGERPDDPPLWPASEPIRPRSAARSASDR